MKPSIDSKGNNYIDIDNIRITLVKHTSRATAKSWPGCDVIRIQAYRKNPTISKALHQGAEFPINMKDKIIELVRVLLEMHKIK